MPHLYTIEKQQMKNRPTTIEEVNQVTKTLNSYFTSIGLSTSVCQSRTSFGASNYIYVNYNDGETYKIRISDHSVMNNGRILDEIHYLGFNHDEIINMVEYRRFPERFTFAEYVCMSDIYESTVLESDFHKLKNVIRATPFVSKKGNNMMRSVVYKTRNQLVRI